MRSPGAACWKGWWRYTDLDDAIAILKAIALGSVAFVVCMRFVLGNDAFPRTIYVLEPLLSALLLGGARLFSRVLAESVQSESIICRDVILIGAGPRRKGRSGKSRAREAAVAPSPASMTTRSMIGMKIHGIPVLGAVDELPIIAAKFKVSEVLIAVPSATADQMRRFVAICGQANVQFRFAAFLARNSQRTKRSRIRAMKFPRKTFSGARPWKSTWNRCEKQIAGKTVLVTGAAGTIGSELCRQILECGPDTLLCLDHNETGIFYLQMELSKRKKETQLDLLCHRSGRCRADERPSCRAQAQHDFSRGGLQARAHDGNERLRRGEEQYFRTTRIARHRRGKRMFPFCADFIGQGGESRQAAKSFELWTGQSASYEALRRAAKEVPE